MLRRKRKQTGQSLVEFALILPVLLMLLLGVIEGARIVWAFITVQTRRRARRRDMPITGRPYVGNQSSPLCKTIEGDPTSSEPWLCSGGDRADAIKQVAIKRGQTLAVTDICGDVDISEYNDNENVSGECADRPGAFGVAVTGQAVDNTSTSTTTKIIPLPDYGGDQGLNVSVATYYNVQMIDPIYDTIMGGSFIRVQGQVQMQNEGLDKNPGCGTTTALATNKH